MCRNVYPIRIVRPIDNFKYNEQEAIENVVLDINESDISIDTATLDNPKRSKIKNAKSACARFGCEYCECPAVNYIDNTMTKSKLTWPPQTMNGRPRTITGIRRIVQSIEEAEEELSDNYTKGIKGKSVFLNQPNFDMILDVPTEYMHLVCIGNVKRMIEFTYKIGKNRTRNTNRKRCDPKSFNDLICSVQVLDDFSRRVRNLDTATLKAQEYRNIILFFFPIVLKNIGESEKKECELWLTLVFMIRSCVIPNEEFDNVKRQTIFDACELFYNLFFELYGQKHCIYSVHVVGSHLLKMRGDVPLTERSAFQFESFYSEMKNLFKSGTNAPLKQILRNTIMKRTLEYHTCKKTIKYCVPSKNAPMENNSLIYTYENEIYNLYTITEIDGDDFVCKKQGKFQYKPSVLPNYDWKSIGIFRKGPIGDKSFRILRSEVKGKVINVLDILITCPENVLHEK